ncbi:hypothetical protein EVAR_100206_1 [Eumeta japonica]|uniref:Uncharacterized protein n=1 Tax=Eumeta variegata TaxID=151549 RepID=A0A4C1ZGF7_EUMVA|nr:hypothetical protein EVAR_100206_1 [Eumeta japonica]
MCSLEIMTCLKAYRLQAPLVEEGRFDLSEIVAEAALTKKTTADYDRFLPSYAKKVEQAYKVLRQADMTSKIAQTLKEHGGFARYMSRFKLKDSRCRACDPAKIQNVLHVLGYANTNAICSFGSVRHCKQR